MGTHRNTWKQRERDAAAIFGARRRVLSGSSGRSEVDGDDADHPRLWIEVKLRASTAVRSLWQKTRDLARKRPFTFQAGHKAPVLMLYDKGKPGALIVVHEDDFRAVAVEYLSAQDGEEVLKFERDVRVRRMNITEDD